MQQVRCFTGTALRQNDPFQLADEPLNVDLRVGFDLRNAPPVVCCFKGPNLHAVPVNIHFRGVAKQNRRLGLCLHHPLLWTDVPNKCPSLGFTWAACIEVVVQDLPTAAGMSSQHVRLGPRQVHVREFHPALFFLHVDPGRASSGGVHLTNRGGIDTESRDQALGPQRGFVRGRSPNKPCRIAKPRLLAGRERVEVLDERTGDDQRLSSANSLAG